MPQSKKLHHKISNKLDQLHELIDKFDEVRMIDSDDPETWDSDTLYNLVENLKKTLKLLEDKKSSQAKDPFGDPIILEAGLCSLVDEYQENENEADSDF